MPTPDSNHNDDSDDSDDSDHRDQGFERLVFFTDAVVAIAITLVVLPLVESARDLRGQPAAHFLEENAADLQAAAISFIVIAAFWRDHHATFASATGYTTRVLRINLVWIAGIVVLPVVTMVDVGSPHNDRLADGLYLGDVALLMIVARIGELVLVRAGLVRNQRRLTRAVVVENCVAPVLMLAALVLSLTVPSVGVRPALLLLLAKPLRALVTRVGNRTPTAGLNAS